ncbi:hypothetical protein SPRG_04326 [Saprolegnia parasitica CBS 223.65]|uniref:Uncharacterized protein n=1 Tax=Saprolegnia parasitica (strain CBS 223.65) TaxID=695850 RepID=A0A067CI48_SAPPC|nr:hypothetical protein SPRG_04326 [Saprolegnia parasitica CBS 223.65]KDO30424.1 hypothetical protein SPRG_04326 [Saprolegnia parasitica CBS 223.65]|eukprot:XP_012198646.1 hypothetical protein SPRG_04326 [Saprolegnia parasitica CBS 223.65]
MCILVNNRDHTATAASTPSTGGCRRPLAPPVLKPLLPQPSTPTSSSSSSSSPLLPSLHLLQQFGKFAPLPRLVRSISMQIPPLASIDRQISCPVTTTTTTELKPLSKKRKMTMDDITSTLESPPFKKERRDVPSTPTPAPLAPRPSLLLLLRVPSTARQPSTIARLKTGKDVCVVLTAAGVVDWTATYYMYGFDKNSVFYSLMPLRKLHEPWSIAETRYCVELVRLLQAGHMRVPQGRMMDTYIAEKLHCDGLRVSKKLRAIKKRDHAAMGKFVGMSPTQVNILKDCKVDFLKGLQPEIDAIMEKEHLDQSWVVTVKHPVHAQQHHASPSSST